MPNQTKTPNQPYKTHPSTLIFGPETGQGQGQRLQVAWPGMWPFFPSWDEDVNTNNMGEHTISHLNTGFHVYFTVSLKHPMVSRKAIQQGIIRMGHGTIYCGASNWTVGWWLSSDSPCWKAMCQIGRIVPIHFVQQILKSDYAHYQWLQMIHTDCFIVFACFSYRLNRLNQPTSYLAQSADVWSQRYADCNGRRKSLMYISVELRESVPFQDRFVLVPGWIHWGQGTTWCSLQW